MRLEHWSYTLPLRLRALFRRGKVDRELDEELQDHINRFMEEAVAKGLPPEDARHAAMRAMDGLEKHKEECRDISRVKLIESLIRDARYASRLLRKNPGFTLVAVLTLALGIGANTAIFSIVDAALIHVLPYPSADRLVTVWSVSTKRGVDHGSISAADYYDWRSQNVVFESLAAHASWPLNLTNVAEPARLNAELVSANFYATLRVNAALGRTFRPDEEQAGKDAVAVISHRLWRQLGGTPDIVGRSLTLNGGQETVVGVMPAWFGFPSPATDIWVPLSLSAENRANREGRWLSVFGRLKSNATVASAGEGMRVVTGRLAREYPAPDAGWSARLISLRDETTGKVRPVILALQATVGLLLLMACTNLANLTLARAAVRSREIAIRASLGAGRGQIVRQLLMESLLLTTLGGLLGLLLARFAVAWIRVSGLDLAPDASTIGIHSSVLWFAVLASCLTGVLFGLVPAVHASRIDLQKALKSGGRGSQANVERQRNLLVTAGVALAFVLLVGAGLLTRSLARLMSVDPGFRPDHVLTLRLTLSRSRYPSSQKQAAFFGEVLDSIKALPGVLSAGAVSDLPLGGNNMTFEIVPDGMDRSAREPQPVAALRVISPGYLAAIGIPLLAGRAFRDPAPETDADVIINDTMAHRYWPGMNPVGRRVRLKDDQRWLTVIGVVRNIKHMGLAAEEGPVLYIPYAQKTQDWLGWAALVVRTAGDPLDYAGAVRARIRSIDRDQPVADVGAFDQALAQATAVPRFTAAIVAGISAVALVISLIGVYGVLAWAVAQRTQEIGIRAALGASPNQLMWYFLGRGLRRVLMGICAGILGGLALTRLLAGLLFGVRPTDPATFVTVAIVLFACAAIALWLPVRRALRLDPTRALRFD